MHKQEANDGAFMAGFSDGSAIPLPEARSVWIAWALGIGLNEKQREAVEAKGKDRGQLEGIAWAHSVADYGVLKPQPPEGLNYLDMLADRLDKGSRTNGL